MQHVHDVRRRHVVIAYEIHIKSTSTGKFCKRASKHHRACQLNFCAVLQFIQHCHFFTAQHMSGIRRQVLKNLTQCHIMSWVRDGLERTSSVLCSYTPQCKTFPHAAMHRHQVFFHVSKDVCWLRNGARDYGVKHIQSQHSDLRVLRKNLFSIQVHAPRLTMRRTRRLTAQYVRTGSFATIFTNAGTLRRFCGSSATYAAIACLPLFTPPTSGSASQRACSCSRIL